MKEVTEKEVLVKKVMEKDVLVLAGVELTFRKDWREEESLLVVKSVFCWVEVVSVGHCQVEQLLQKLE